MDASFITALADMLKSTGPYGAMVILGIALWRKDQELNRAREEHAKAQREDLTNILTTANTVTAALASVERAVFGNRPPHV